MSPGLTPDMQQEAANIPETIKTSGSDEDGDVQAQRVVESSFQKLRPSWMNLLVSQSHVTTGGASMASSRYWKDQVETDHRFMMAVAGGSHALQVLRTFKQLMGQGNHPIDAISQST